MARDLDSPVLCVSSMNRASYDKDKSMNAFKESGGIEYGADVAAMLTPDVAEASGADAYRPMKLTIVKHRNGERGVITLKFHAERSEFVETGKDDDALRPHQ